MVTYEESCERMRQAVETSRIDTETGHAQADDLLVEWMRSKGENELADLYEAVEKWYS